MWLSTECSQSPMIAHPQLALREVHLVHLVQLMVKLQSLPKPTFIAKLLLARLPTFAFQPQDVYLNVSASKSKIANACFSTKALILTQYPVCKVPVI